MMRKICKPRISDKILILDDCNTLPSQNFKINVKHIKNMNSQKRQHNDTKF